MSERDKSSMDSVQSGQSPQQGLNKSNSKAVLRQASASKLQSPVNTKNQLTNLLQKVKSYSQDDTATKKMGLPRKKSLAELETIKLNAKVQKSRDYLLSMVESFNQQSEKMPRWRFKLNGIMNPDEKLVLKGKALWRAITKAYIGLAIRPILIKNKIKLITRDQECLELARAIHIYSESCDFWLGKLVQVPLKSLCQDSTLDFVPQTFMRRSIKERRKVQLKVRVYAMINAIVSSGDPPDHIIKFLASLTEDENYFPSGFLFRVERKALMLDKLGATQNMVTHVSHTPTTTLTSRHHCNMNNDLNITAGVTLSTSSKSTTVTDPNSVKEEEKEKDSNCNNNNNNNNTNNNNNECTSIINKPFQVQISDPRLLKGGGCNNSAAADLKNSRTFDASRVKMMVSNFLIVRILINHLCLCPWKHSGYPPDDDYEAKCIVNSRILATILYEVVRNIDGSVLPSIDSIDAQQHHLQQHSSQGNNTSKSNATSHRKLSISQYQRGVSDFSNSADDVLIPPTTATTNDKKRVSINNSQTRKNQNGTDTNTNNHNNNDNDNNHNSALSKSSVFIPIQPTFNINKISSIQKPSRSLLMRMAIVLGFRDDTIKIIEEDKIVSKEIATYLTGVREPFCTCRELFHVLYPLEFLKIGYGIDIIALWVKELAPLLNEWIESVTLAVLMKQQDKLFQYFDVNEDNENKNGNNTTHNNNGNNNDNNNSMRAYYSLKNGQKKQKEQLKNDLISESVKNTLIKQQKNENIMQYLNNCTNINQLHEHSTRSNNNKASPRTNVHFQELTKVHPLITTNSQMVDVTKQKPYL